MPATGVRPWKGGHEDHGRTFLKSPGSYRRSPMDEDRHGEVVYWAEWEGAVSLVRRLEGGGRSPRWLCRADRSAPPPLSNDGAPPQNTDPYVWGDTMRYTYCRQDKNGKLRRLGRGSVILFGSSVQHQFVLDTVLVVAGWIEHRASADLAGITDQAHMRATIEPMYGWRDTGLTYRLYIGATPADPVDGMFSFVPCRPASSSDVGFARPAIRLNGLINPNTRMQARMLDVPDSRIPELWQSVSYGVCAGGLSLATQLRLE